MCCWLLRRRWNWYIPGCGKPLNVARRRLQPKAHVRRRWSPVPPTNATLFLKGLARMTGATKMESLKTGKRADVPAPVRVQTI